MTCFRDAVQTLSIKVLFFKGYKDIEVREVPKDNSQYETFKDLLKERIIGLVSWLGITPEELGFVDAPVIVGIAPEFTEVPGFTGNSINSIKPKLTVGV
ncbi:hypothetical protein LCGC14_2446500 [marine sediment metagenome]|uniref:Uncharacterized protein n=1 Tax=marine sediment metagenome TaxID=412755 RepID=A0A0F9BHJ5_9ZZZZ